MGKRISKSRTFAVVLTWGEKLCVKFLWMQTPTNTFDEPELVEKQQYTRWPLEDKDQLIELLVNGGLTVRFYDPEEKQWMDHSLTYGYNAAPGARDGQYSTPTIEEFKEDYLGRT